MLSALRQDLRHGLRALQRAPMFHLGAIAILAIGIGATTAAFSIVDGVLIRPLPYPAAERLVQIGSTFRMDPDRLGPLSEPDAVALQRSTSTLEAFAAVGGGNQILLGTGEPEELSVANITEGYLDMLGARPTLGRLFLPDDHAAGASRVVVLDHGFWLDRYGGDIGVVGRTMSLDPRADVVGTMVRHALGTAAVGVVLGTAGGLVLMRLLTSFLFGVTPQDPATFGVVALAVAAAAATAAYLPARRAARADPCVTLREE